MHPIDLLRKKRDGGELSRMEIDVFVRSATQRAGTETACFAEEGSVAADRPTETGVSEAQMGSLLMAIFQRGLSSRELADLTDAMRHSGESLGARELGGFPVDKHSTGGVGDKTSLLIAPMVAAAGVCASAGNDRERRTYVPMISGRSLGHTGGTLDKLETIPGFRTQMARTEVMAALRRSGAVMIGQTPQLVPADRVLYAMRDHTGTVECPELIAASIMSKKLAEELRGLVLDVKVGSGAFLPSYKASRRLAELMVHTGQSAGTRTVALLTAMEQPLGRFAGNWVEVWECVDVMRGVRHPMSADLVSLACTLAGWMLHLAGLAATAAQGAKLAETVLEDGCAYHAWICMVQAQGGDALVFDNPASFHQPRANRVVHAPKTGYLASMDCKQVGWAVQRLGAGRSHPGQPIDPHAGLEVHAKLGQLMQAGQPVFTLFSNEESLLEEPYQMLRATLQFDDEPPLPVSLVQEVIQLGC